MSSVHGLLDHLPHSKTTLARATACVYFHRFYMFHSFKQHDRYVVAAACLFLAFKVEEEKKYLSVFVRAFFETKNKLNPQNVSEAVSEDTFRTAL